MKNILITGANSYIGTSFETYLSQWPEQFRTETLDMIGDAWRNHSFAGFDSVFHVAGIAHSDVGKISEARREEYYRVNTDLAVETAAKAKAQGVKQFIFMSSAIVYGNSAGLGEKKHITRDTPVAPANCYGDSKAKAEEGILALQDDSFRVVILRPPMVYGPGSKGNYPTLAKLARKLPLFPAVDNSRSMLYVKNLMEFIRLMVVNEERGIFWPQNREYVNTTVLAQAIARAHGKKLMALPGCNWALKLLSHATGLVDKAFGSLTYDMSLSEYREDYRISDFENSILETEGIS
jgi:UDP-glucose 4-epimerase